MDSLRDRQRLGEQYRNAGNLNARIALHQRFSVNPYPWTRWVFDHFDLPEGARLLEVGCGPGTLWLENLDHLPASWRVTLGDLSPGMLTEARGSLGGNSFAFKVFDVQAIPFEDSGFDAVIANHMLYHVPDLNRALGEIRRVLKPGGCLYAATNGREHLSELWDLVRRLKPDFAFPDLGFTLERGHAQLSRHFSEVRLHHDDNPLNVTESEPLVAYLLSMNAWPEGLEDSCDALTRMIEEELAEKGGIHLSRAVGMFVAR